MQQGLSQAKLGKIVGAAQRSVCSWENGNKIPSVEHALILAEALKTTVQKLFWLSND